MNTHTFKLKQLVIAIGTGTFMVLAGPLVADLPALSSIDVVASAYADSHGGEGKGPNAGAPQGKQGSGHDAGGASRTTESVLSEEEEGDEGHKGHEGGPQHDIDKQKGTPNPGDHGDSEDGDGKGPRAGSGGASGGKPTWAQEGIPEVELGRLNVARSPEAVLDKAYLEALKTLLNTGDLYTITDKDELLAALASEPTRVDSPLENLALYKTLLTEHTLVLSDGTVLVTEENEVLIAAFLLGSASDKTVEITTDTVTAINTILGVELPTGTSLEQFAETADEIREKIYEVHEQ